MAILGKVGLLKAFVRGRGRWCASIEHEWRRSCSKLGLDAADELVRSVCGQPIQPTPVELVSMKVLINRMRAPGDPESKHAGEAETIAIIGLRQEFYHSIFLTDDQGARSKAGAEEAVDRCLGTTELLAYFEVAGWLTRCQAHDCLTDLRRKGRHVFPKDSKAYDGLVQALHRKR